MKSPLFRSEPVLNVVLRSIHEPTLAVAACNSLEAISTICRDHIRSHFAVLLQVVEVLVQLPIPAETAVRVVKGVTKVCSRLDETQLVDGLQRLCKVHVEELTRICQVSKCRFPEILSPTHYFRGFFSRRWER